MIMRSIVLFMLAVAAMAVGTWYVGWWMVPVVGAVWGFVAVADRALPLQAALAGVNAWGILLALRMPGGGVERVAGSVGTLLSIGGAALIALTLLYPALLAASAAMLVRAVRGGERGATGAGSRAA
jgi:hypothetical protein